jgi:starch synthase
LRAHVLIVASEAVPLVKAGGLGDVTTALAAALHERGIAATILMPGYPAAIEGAGPLQQVALLDDLPLGPCRSTLRAAG